MEALKNIFSPTFISGVADSLKAVYPPLSATEFIHAIFNEDWDNKELKQRIRHLSNVIHQFLTNNFTTDSGILISWVHFLKQEHGEKQSLEYIFLADYIEVYGQHDFTCSLNAIEEITQFTSCEFAIRPFIVKSPEKVMKQMLKWSKHKNQHIRRLASEGCRPRLPWGMAIQVFKKDPSLIIPVLENLKNDPSLYVRKSIANNLNDIAKDNPNIVIDLIQRWKGHSANTDWMLKHGARSLLKKANVEVLTLFGIDSNVKCSVVEFKLHKKIIQLGRELTFSCILKNDSKKEMRFRIEFAVYYMKSSGKQSRKLFKINEKAYPKDALISFTKNISFRDLTTRKHYEGLHKIAIVVNGNEVCENEFHIVA
jgi:3-methyladenine DNA glycosylase AlkC